jgi:hypoxanthine phosphoribosyltransferase
MHNILADANAEILLPAEKIAARVRELAAEISRDYHDQSPHLIGILKGAWVFMADLIRQLDLDATVDFLGIASYGASTTSSGEVKITKDLDTSIEGRHVLVVEDILDTGRTFHYLREVLLARQPLTLRLVTLLDKPSRRVIPISADYIGLTIPDVFVVGYGLDYGQKCRGLPDVWSIPPTTSA